VYLQVSTSKSIPQSSDRETYGVGGVSGDQSLYWDCRTALWTSRRIHTSIQRHSACCLQNCGKTERQIVIQDSGSVSVLPFSLPHEACSIIRCPLAYRIVMVEQHCLLFQSIDLPPMSTVSPSRTEPSTSVSGSRVLGRSIIYRRPHKILVLAYRHTMGCMYTSRCAFL
jgi:hypothetical protein